MLTLAAFNARRARGFRPAASPAADPPPTGSTDDWLGTSGTGQACPRCGADLASPDPVPLHQLPGPHDIDPDAPTADDIAAAARASAAHQDHGTPPAAPRQDHDAADSYGPAANGASPPAPLVST